VAKFQVIACKCCLGSSNTTGACKYCLTAVATPLVHASVASAVTTPLIHASVASAIATPVARQTCYFFQVVVDWVGIKTINIDFVHHGEFHTFRFCKRLTAGHGSGSCKIPDWADFNPD